MGIQARNPNEEDELVDAVGVTLDGDDGDDGDVAVEPLTAIDHVTIAVEDIDQAIEDYRETFGALVDHREMVDGEGVELAILRVGDGAVHLVTPTRDDSPVAAFLTERGPGIHHVGYRVDDVVAALAACEARGLRLVDAEPVAGVLGSTVAFVHPNALHGTLIQLVQR